MITGLIIGAVVGFIIGIFVYRNNVDTFSPFAEKIDEVYDNLEVKINELEKKIDKK